MRINEKLAVLLTLLMEQSWHPESMMVSRKRVELLEVKSYLDEHYTEKIVLDDLAEHFFINKFYMTRIFKENLCVFLMNHYSGNETVNAGTGKELTIRELTELVAKVVGYTGKIEWDTSRPNGTPRKLLDVSKAEKLGWTYKTELEDGLRLSYEDFLHNPMRAER